MKLFERFMEKAQTFNIPVQVGIVILKSPQMGQFMNKNVSGIHVPEAWIEEIGPWPKRTGRKSR